MTDGAIKEKKLKSTPLKHAKAFKKQFTFKQVDLRSN